MNRARAASAIRICIIGMRSGIVECMPESLKSSTINRSKSAVARPGDVVKSAVARSGDVVESLHGEAVPDPYRWLERAADPETAAWVSKQNKGTQAWLGGGPARAQIPSQLGEQWNYARFGVPFERGGRWFQTRNSGLQAQPVLYVMEAPKDEGRALI